MSIEDNKATVRRFLEALDQQNFDALKEHPQADPPAGSRAPHATRPAA